MVKKKSSRAYVMYKFCERSKFNTTCTMFVHGVSRCYLERSYFQQKHNYYYNVIFNISEKKRQKVFVQREMVVVEGGGVYFRSYLVVYNNITYTIMLTQCLSL